MQIVISFLSLKPIFTSLTCDIVFVAVGIAIGSLPPPTTNLVVYPNYHDLVVPGIGYLSSVFLRHNFNIKLKEAAHPRQRLFLQHVDLSFCHGMERFTE